MPHDTSPSPLDPELLDRYLASELPPDTHAAVERELASSPDGAMLLHAIRAAHDTSEFVPDTARMWAHVQRGRAPEGSPGHPAARRRMARVALGAAGIAAMCALVATAIGIGRRERAPRTFAQTRMYTTEPGQRATVTLLSGATATLGPATTLTVVQSDGETQVTLTGQAVFAVTPNDRTVFTVHAGRAVTRVLGTRFIVQRYADDRVARIAVVEGRVSVQHDSSRARAVLAAHMLGTVTDSGRVSVTPSIVVDDYTAWTSGRLVFRQTSVREIVASLSRAYDADIRLADSVLARRAFTWTVSVDRLSLAGAITALVTSLDAHAVTTGKTITIIPGPAPARLPGGVRIPPTQERPYGR